MLSRLVFVVGLATSHAGASPSVAPMHDSIVLTSSPEPEKSSYSPLLSAVQAVYNRSPLKPVVNVVTPQVAVVCNAVRVGAERTRRHVSLPTAASVALAVLPLGTQRTVIRTVAASGLLVALLSSAREARLEQSLTILADPSSSSERWAVVTGCGERAGLGSSAAKTLASKGYGVVVVADHEAEAKALVRRLRLDYGTPCIPVVADFESDAAAAVRSLRSSLRHANITADVDILIHSPSQNFLLNTNKKHVHEPAVPVPAPKPPPPSPPSPSTPPPPPSATFPEIVSPTSSTWNGHYDDVGVDDSHRWDVPMQARCCAATHLAHVFGSEMAARGRGRVAFVVGGKIEEPQSSSYSEWFATRSTLIASDAYTRTLALTLRRDLARSGVGVTVATRDTGIPLPWRTPNLKAPSPGDRLVKALLRGEAHVALNKNYHLGAAVGAPRFAMVATSPPGTSK